MRNRRFRFRSTLFAAFVLTASTLAAEPSLGQSPHYTAQIDLSYLGVPFNAAALLRIEAYAAPTGGLPIAAAQFQNVQFRDGLATVRVAGEQLLELPEQWLQINVALAGDGVFTDLQPRLRLKASPVAVVGTRAAPGSIGAEAIDTSQVQRRVLPCTATHPRLRGVGSDGAVDCDVDKVAVTSVAAGPGILVSTDGATSSIDANWQTIQRRVTAGCAEGSSIGSIAANGNIDCRIDSRTRGSAMVNVQGSCTIGGNDGTVTRCVAQAVCPPAQPVPLSAAFGADCPGASALSLRPIETPQGVGYASEIYKPADLSCGIPTATHSVHVICSPGG